MDFASNLAYTYVQMSGNATPDTYIRTFEFPACWLHWHTWGVHVVHRADHSSSVFMPPEEPQAYLNFCEAARQFGYTDILTYAREHELAHQFVSLEMGRECSWIVWDDAHKAEQVEGLEPPEWCDEWPNRPQDEEHAVNRFLLFVNTGKLDEEGCLRGLFGNRLEEMAARFLLMTRPWLQERAA